MAATSDYVVLAGGAASLILSCRPGTRPAILYWGQRLARPDPELLAQISKRPYAPGGPDTEIAASLLNETGAGFAGASGFAAHRSGHNWASLFLVTRIEQPTRDAVRILCDDAHSDIRVEHDLALDQQTGVLQAATRVVNEGQADLTLDWCAAICLPLDPRLTRLAGFTGRWALEFQTETLPVFTGSYVRENKAGRTSHDCFPALIACGDMTGEEQGLCTAFHLGWSGNSRLRADRVSDGRAFIQMGEYFHPGEVILAPGEAYGTPTLYAACSDNGLGALSRAFHAHLRARVINDRPRQKPRPVHFNSWEAVYFDHNPQKLIALAEAAAQAGAERFVLDDGWFSSRRNDRSGLGDWWPSPDIYPEGLGPLIAQVQRLGMEFGLWVEPEMVNPDSDLYRAHPDWVLGVDGVVPIASRGQLVLDLTRDEVSDYLFTALDRLLSDHAIAYLKWDMNRDIQHPGSRGRAVASAQTRALYRLLQRVRDAHPALEIESCASGGGRADYGILRYTDRLWTSDNHDALDRRAIQRGASHFFPPEILGTHVGPQRCHITGRHLGMELRVATAFIGHMGMELDLLAETPADRDILKAGIALHKRHRALLHQGDFYRLETPAFGDAVGVVAQDRREALYSWCTMVNHRETLPGRFYPVGLDADVIYCLRIIWPTTSGRYDAAHPIGNRNERTLLEGAAASADGGLLISGKMLQAAGAELPLMPPQSGLIFHLIAV